VRSSLNYGRIAEMIGTLIRNIRGEKGSVEGSANLDWKRLLNLKETRVLGLDIGSSTVKVVRLRRNGDGFAVTAAGIVDIAGEEESDENRKEINTVSAVSECLQSAGIQTALAVCSVCGPEVAVRYFKFPSLLPEEIEGAVLLEAAQVCPFNVDDGAVDYQLMPDGADSVYGVLVAATNKLIKRKSELAEEATLNTVLMDVDGLALLNCFSECEETKAGLTTAILNVGSSFTNLAIMSSDSLPFIRDIAYAGETIIKEIAAEKGVRPETISRILSGCEDSNGAQLEIGDSLEKACRKLIVDVTETLRYYATQEKSAIVEKIFVCGGFALVKGFVELLDEQLPAAFALWNPFDKIGCDAGQKCRDILQRSGPAMVVAAGLAMRSI
jgi:type IV pilus assembly protein PilM